MGGYGYTCEGTIWEVEIDLRSSEETFSDDTTDDYKLQSKHVLWSLALLHEHRRSVSRVCWTPPDGTGLSGVAPPCLPITIIPLLILVLLCAFLPIGLVFIGLVFIRFV